MKKMFPNLDAVFLLNNFYIDGRNIYLIILRTIEFCFFKKVYLKDNKLMSFFMSFSRQPRCFQRKFSNIFLLWTQMPFMWSKLS